VARALALAVQVAKTEALAVAQWGLQGQGKQVLLVI